MNVISSSAGNDSAALIQWAHETSLPNVTVAYINTGWGSRKWPARVDRVEALALSYGFKAVRINSKGMEQLVRERKGFPGNGMQFCTTELKILPFLEWIDGVDPAGLATVVVGKRRAESVARRETPEFIASSEIHGGRRLWHPLYRHTDEQRNELLKRAGIEVLPHRSRECHPCVNANRGDFLSLTPGEIERVNDLEVAIGKPMFRPKRFSALGIYGVIQWAEKGRDRGDIDEEIAECASLFGCGV
ncbi:MAG: phosphoadenosine phosphosulfate reductase [Betaproteobacteria bacterium]|nr:MAG: phosphoadenosine phosphosulfate reductase [Betaproteobacteria bacterium]